MNKLITLAITLLFMTAANAGDPRKTVNDLKARFLKLGEPRIEGLEKHGDVSYPAIYFGRHKINNDFTIVDEIKKHLALTPLSSSRTATSSFGLARTF